MAISTSRWTLLASTALLGLAASSALAQAPAKPAAKTVAATPADTTDSSGSTYLSPLVVTGLAVGGIGDPYATPKAVSTVGSDEINQFGGQNIDNVLRTMPGTFTRDNPQNTGVAVNVRGLEGQGRVGMSIDGARQNFRFTGHEAGGFTYVDPALLSGIDVTRGANTGAAGAGTLSGTANFRTLGVDDVLKDGKPVGGFAAVTAGTNGEGPSESGAAAFRISDTFAVLGAVSKRNSTDYSNANGQVVPYSGQDLLSGLVKAEITPTIDQKLTISGLLYTNKFVANSYAQTLDNRTYSMLYDYTPADNELIDLHAGLHLNQTLMTYGNSPTIAGGGTARGRVIDDKSASIDVTNTSRGSVGDVGLSATYGFTYGGDDVNVRNSTASTASGVNPSGKSTLGSVFGSTTASLGIVDLTGGLRYDQYTVDGAASAIAGNPLGLPVGTFPVNRSGGRLNPSATVALKALDWFQPYVSYAETFRPPTMSELMVGGDHPSGGTAASFVPNPNLVPEVAKTWEIGANVTRDSVFRDGDSVKLKADVFTSSIDNYITAAFAPTGAVYFTNNPGTSNVTGFELQAGYDAGVVFGSLAYTHTTTNLPSQINGFGAQSYLPDDIFTTTLGARLLDDQSLTIGGRLYAVSQSYIGTINATPGQSAYAPGYQLVDLFANYKTPSGIEIGANIQNLFNVAYTPALSTTPSITVPTGRGRTFELTAKANF